MTSLLMVNLIFNNLRPRDLFVALSRLGPHRPLAKWEIQIMANGNGTFYGIWYLRGVMANTLPLFVCNIHITPQAMIGGPMT